MKTPMFPGLGLVSNIVGDLVKAFSPAGTLGALSPEGDLHAMSKVLGLYANVLSTVRFDRSRALEMAQNLDHGGGTDLADLLVTERGLSWRTAHQIRGILFRHCSERHIAAAQVTGELLDEAAVEYFEQPVRLSAGHPTRDGSGSHRQLADAHRRLGAARGPPSTAAADSGRAGG